MAQGKLPNLAGVMKESPLVTLQTPSAALQGCVWPSLLTGLGPGHHGLYLQDQLHPGTYKIVSVRADHVQPERFYQELNRNGVRCGLLDIPADQPLADLNGIQVLEWGTEFRFWRYQTVPASFARHIARRIGRNPFTSQPPSGKSQAEHIQLRSRLETSIRLKTELSLDLIRRRELDFIFTVFGEAHKAGHWLWKYCDTSHPDFENAPPVLSEGLFDIYVQLDESLGRLLAELRPEDNLVILSDHGMQAAYRGNHHIDTILESLGLLKRENVSAAPPQPPGWSRKLLARGAALVRKALSPELASRTVRPIANIDWQHTRAFSLPTDRNSYVRLNVRGCEPQGIVEPGADYRQVLNDLEQELGALINPATGEPAVDTVFRVHEQFPGEHVQDLPDLAVLWAADAPIDELCSPRLGRIHNRYREPRSGNHREEGFLMARGPSFREGAQRLQGNIYQIAPTPLKLYGITPPQPDMEAPLSVILKTGHQN